MGGEWGCGAGVGEGMVEQGLQAAVSRLMKVLSLNSGPLQEQCMLTTIELPLQPSPCLRQDLSLAWGSLIRLGWLVTKL